MIGGVSYGNVAYSEGVHLLDLPRRARGAIGIGPLEMIAELSDEQRLPFLRPGR